MGKVQKKGKWISHELSKLTTQNCCLTVCTLLLFTKSGFCMKL